MLEDCFNISIAPYYKFVCINILYSNEKTHKAATMIQRVIWDVTNRIEDLGLNTFLSLFIGFQAAHIPFHVSHARYKG